MATTPLPIPVHFSHAQQSFSLKRRRVCSSSSSSSALASPAHLSRCLPPCPPSKGCPPVSRLFPQEPPSAWTPLSKSLLASPPPSSLFDPQRRQSFFSQCFTVLGLLGRGSFGEVYKVLSLLDGRQYAVKLSMQRFRNHRDRARCLREARNHERLGCHAHVLGFVAAWEERGHLYIQTELCCTSLLLYVENLISSPDEKTVWGYLCDLLSALCHLHALGFTHMDVKPANVFVTSSGRLKLGDFGLLLETRMFKCENEKKMGGEQEGQKDGVRDGPQDDAQEGDPRYMAPELLRGEYSSSADIFSLGVSILEVACNMEVPKGGEGWQLLRQGVLPSPFTNALSPELQSVLRLMLTPDPHKRPSAKELLDMRPVRAHSWRRRICLAISEAAHTLIALTQSMVSVGWGLLSSLNLPFLPRCAPPAPCTPPRDAWGNEGDSSMLPPSPPTPSPHHSSLHMGHPPERLANHLVFGSTSTPLSGPPSSPKSRHYPTTEAETTETRDWLTTIDSVAQTPPSSHSGSRSGSGRLKMGEVNSGHGNPTPTPSLSPIRQPTPGSSHTLWPHPHGPGSLPDTPSSTRSRSHCCDDEDDWCWSESVKHNFEPKNLLAMFEESF